MQTNLQLVEPIIVIDLFPQERKQLLELLSSFEAEDWEKPTICPGWTVKHIALHLLGDDIGYLSRKRDTFSNPFFQEKDLSKWESLITNINEVNELWVQATARMSPRLLIDLLAFVGEQLYDYMQTLDQMALGDTVSWAGPDPAPVWLDTAREYTERWMHQQQIRDAVNKPGLKEKRFFHPVLDAFMRALPHTYKDISVTSATVIKFVVSGEAGDAWCLLGEANKWSLYKNVPLQPASVVTMDQETCWRLFTKGLSKKEARQQTSIEGDQKLGEILLDTVSIIA